MFLFLNTSDVHLAQNIIFKHWFVRSRAAVMGNPALDPRAAGQFQWLSRCDMSKVWSREIITWLQRTFFHTVYSSYTILYFLIIWEVIMDLTTKNNYETLIKKWFNKILPTFQKSVIIFYIFKDWKHCVIEVDQINNTTNFMHETKMIL